MVLTGGPGTGKTTVTQGIISMYRTFGLKVLLAAPTNRIRRFEADAPNIVCKAKWVFLDFFDAFIPVCFIYFCGKPSTDPIALQKEHEWIRRFDHCGGKPIGRNSRLRPVNRRGLESRLEDACIHRHHLAGRGIVLVKCCLVNPGRKVLIRSDAELIRPCAPLEDFGQFQRLVEVFRKEDEESTNSYRSAEQAAKYLATNEFYLSLMGVKKDDLAFFSPTVNYSSRSSARKMKVGSRRK